MAPVDEADLAAILAAEEERELDEAADAIANAAAAAPLPEEIAEAALPACFSDATGVETALAVAVAADADDAAAPSTSFPALLNAEAAAPAAPQQQSECKETESADDAQEAEEESFGHFEIPEEVPEQLAARPATPTARVVRAPPRPDVSAAAQAPFPFQLDCSEATIVRREEQLLAAQNQLHSLQAEIDLYASKLFQLSQLATQPQFAHLSLAQMLLDALSSGSCGDVEL